MGLDTSTNASLWKDRVSLEINAAVLHSFKEAGVTIVDQHTVCEQFMSHLETEFRIRGGCPADWVWVTPSQSGSLTPVFHQETIHYHLSPSYEKQDCLWSAYRFADDAEKRKLTLRSLSIALLFTVSLFKAKLALRPLAKIFYATETGTAKKYAQKLEKIFTQAFNVQLLDISE